MLALSLVPTKGRNLKDVIDDSNPDLIVSGSVAEALDSPTDVLVDYTNADVVKANVMTAIRKGVHVVIGSSGLTDEDFIEINHSALEHKVGVIAAGNFALTAVLLQLERIENRFAGILPECPGNEGQRKKGAL